MNSPACVDGALPRRLSARARANVCFSGISHLSRNLSFAKASATSVCSQQPSAPVAVGGFSHRKSADMRDRVQPSPHRGISKTRRRLQNRSRMGHTLSYLPENTAFSQCLFLGVFIQKYRRRCVGLGSRTARGRTRARSSGSARDRSAHPAITLSFPVLKGEGCREF